MVGEQPMSYQSVPSMYPSGDREAKTTVDLNPTFFSYSHRLDPVIASFDPHLRTGDSSSTSSRVDSNRNFNWMGNERTEYIKCPQCLLVSGHPHSDTGDTEGQCDICNGLCYFCCSSLETMLHLPCRYGPGINPDDILGSG